MVRKDFVRAEAWLRDNELFVRELLKRSYLKEKTLKALLFHSWARDSTFEEIAKILKMQQAGAWKCWQRGKNSIFKAFCTLTLALHAGVLDLDSAQLMLDNLVDFTNVMRGEGDREEIRYRIELRMREIFGMMRPARSKAVPRTKRRPASAKRI